MVEEKKDGKTDKEEALKKRPTAEKRALQSEKRRLHNRQYRSRIASAIAGLKELTVAGDQKEAVKKQLGLVHSLLDKAVKTKLFTLNKVSRMKSRL